MRFIDLFGGIGGFSLGLERCGHECVDYIELDKKAVSVYNANFRTDHEARDITEVAAEDVPDHDLLCAGFPCQDASIAGKRAGLRGKRTSLFSEIVRIAEEKRPPTLLLENVKGLLSVNGGWDFAFILARLDEIGYDAEWDVLNAKDVVPQNRERVFIVGHLRGEPARQVFPIRPSDKENNRDVQDSRQVDTCLDANYAKGWLDHGQRTMILSHSRDEAEKLRGYTPKDEAGTIKPPTGNQQNLVVHSLQKRSADRPSLVKNPHAGGSGHLSGSDGLTYCLDTANNMAVEVTPVVHPRGRFKQRGRLMKEPGEPSFTMRPHRAAASIRRIDKGAEHYQDRVYSPEGLAPTLPTTATGGNLVPKIQNETRIRRLTPLECERLMGFPDGWTECGQDGAKMSDTARYRMLGNAVVPPVIEAIGRTLTEQPHADTPSEASGRLRK